MAIVRYRARHKRHVRGTHVEVGQMLYAVQKGPWFFIWAYTNEQTAVKIDRKLGEGPTDPAEISANWRRSLEQLIPSGLAPEKV